MNEQLLYFCVQSYLVFEVNEQHVCRSQVSCYLVNLLNF